MIRIYRFAGDDPSACGGTVLRVVGDLVALDVGDDSSVVERLIPRTPGWALVDVGGLEALPVAIPQDVIAAIEAVAATSGASPRSTHEERDAKVADLVAALDAARSI